MHPIPSAKVGARCDHPNGGARAWKPPKTPKLGAWISVGGWPVFSSNALDPVPPTTKFVSFDTVPAAIALLRAGKVQVLLGQKYFGWGEESVKLLHGIVNGRKPANVIVDSGVDVVTPDTVDAYEASWKAMAAGGKK